MLDSTSYVELLRKMGHDMRVPLNTLISTTDMLVEGLYDPLTPKQAKAATRLQRNTHRLLALLEDFVIYVKADADDLPLSANPFNPRECLEDWLNQVRSITEEKGLSTRLIVSQAVPEMLVGDETIIGRVVLALLWNAAAFTAQGEICLTSDWTSNQIWNISVQDTGSGISDVDLPHIYEPFYRGEERPQVPTAGAGLGLPMARALVRLMDGKLFMKETGQKGTQFCVELRLNPDDSK